MKVLLKFMFVYVFLFLLLLLEPAGASGKCSDFFGNNKLTKGFKARGSILKLANGENFFSEKKHIYALDKKTRDDLEFDKLVVPGLRGMAQTELGKARLEWLLKNPLMNRDDIIKRQVVVKLIAQDTQLLSDLKLYFKSLDKVLDNNFVKKANERVNEQNKNENSFFNKRVKIMSAISASLLGLTAWSAYLGDTSQMSIAILVPVMSWLNNFGGAKITGNIARAFLSAKEIGHKLKDTSNPELKEIYQELFNSGTLSELKKLNKTFNSIPKNLVSEFREEITMRNGWHTTSANKQLAKHEAEVARTLSALAELEAYTAIADFYVKNKSELIFPQFVEADNPFIIIRSGHHPFQFFESKFVSVPNTVELTRDYENKFALLTGPNTGGKTTYLRMAGLLPIMAQAGFPVPAESMRLTPLRVITNFNTNDSTETGKSTFYRQSERIRELEKESLQNKSVFVLMDEILVGTSEIEHLAAEQAVIETFYNNKNVISILATHGREATKLEDQLVNLTNFHITLRGHKIKEGISTDYNAVDVMRETGISRTITDRTDELIKQRREKIKEQS